MICTEHDVFWICRGHYDHGKYASEKMALEEYYYRHYSYPGEKQELPFYFLVSVFMAPAVQKIVNAGNLRSFLHNGIFERSYMEYNLNPAKKPTDFYEVLYYRILKWFNDIPVRDFDTKEYLIDVREYSRKDRLFDGGREM